MSPPPYGFKPSSGSQAWCRGALSSKPSGQPYLLLPTFSLLLLRAVYPPPPRPMLPVRPHHRLTLAPVSKVIKVQRARGHHAVCHSPSAASIVTVSPSPLALLHWALLWDNPCCTALLYMGVKTNESTPQKQKPCLYHSVLWNILYTIKFTHFKL